MRARSCSAQGSCPRPQRSLRGPVPRRSEAAEGVGVAPQLHSGRRRVPCTLAEPAVLTGLSGLSPLPEACAERTELQGSAAGPVERGSPTPLPLKAPERKRSRNPVVDHTSLFS